MSNDNPVVTIRRRQWSPNRSNLADWTSARRRCCADRAEQISLPALLGRWLWFYVEKLQEIGGIVG